MLSNDVVDAKIDGASVFLEAVKRLQHNADCSQLDFSKKP